MPIYLIAITPSNEVSEIAKQYQERYPEYNRYRVPPHITLHPPCSLINATETEIVMALTEHLQSQQCSTITLTEIDYFSSGNNVIYLKPDLASTEFLRLLATSIAEWLADRTRATFPEYTRTKYDFHPHITLAERIPNEKFEKVKQEIGQLETPLTFPVITVDIYERTEETKQYTKILEIPLKK